MPEEKKKVAILFGGRSAEHEVSLQSAKNVIEAIDRDKFEPILIAIDKNGQWLLCDEINYLTHPDDPKNIKINKEKTEQITLLPWSGGEIYSLDSRENVGTIDIALPVLHGTYGEDGTMQGLLELADVPFVGAGVLGSAVGMDKDVMKRLLKEADLPIGNFFSIRSGEEIPLYSEIVADLGEPFFIKPANMGSSVGISKVHDESEYQKAIKEAFKFDNKIIIEEFIKGREIECAVLGNERPEASIPGEIKPTHEFYSYDAKYIDKNGAAAEIPAKISEEETKKIQKIAIKTFKTLECSGLGRVDSFLTKSGEVYVNEINTLPGFTEISMYPKLWEASGVSYTDLITKLIDLAIDKFDREQKIQTDYVS